MRCCVDCFRDSRIRNFVAENGSQGDCDFCGSTDMQGVDPAALAQLFDEIMAYFKPADESPTTLTLADLGQNLPSMFFPAGRPLADLFQDRLQLFRPSAKLGGPPLLGLFTKYAQPWQHSLVVAILGSSRAQVDRRWVFAGPRHGDLRAVEHWHRFSNDLLHERRFIPSYKAGEVEMRRVLEEALRLGAKRLDGSIPLFRARIGCGVPDLKNGRLHVPLPLAEMGAPPADKTHKGGRINPPGIRVLYLASDAATAVREVRPPIDAKVTICSWTVNDTLIVADLIGVDPLDTVFGQADLAWYLECRELLEFLSYAFAQPVDPDAWSTEYAPTQYAAEVIRDMDIAGAHFDGIMYQSVFGEGANVALFDERAATAVEPVLVRVTKLTYETEPLPNLPNIPALIADP